MVREGFGLRAYNRRKELNLERSYVAKEVGIAYQNLSKIEDGKIKCPLGKTVNALAEVLKTTPSYLLDGVGFPDSPGANFSTKIPVLDWSETNEWCKTVNKDLSQKEREYIQNPTRHHGKDIFAVKVQSDSMECSSNKGLPKGCFVICRPTNHIHADKIIIFYDEDAGSSFLREVVIEEKPRLKPLNPQYKIKDFTEKLSPIAEVIGMTNLF